MNRRDFMQFMALSFVPPRGLDDEWLARISRPTSGPVSAPAYTATGSGKGSVFLFMESMNGSSRIMRHLDWNTLEFTDHAIPLSLPHSLVQDKHDKNVVFVFETFGSFLRYDMKSKQVIKIDHAHRKNMSYGHATLSANGELLCTEVDPGGSRGVVNVRSPKTLELIGALPSECEGSHQIAMLPGTRLAACGVASDFGRGEKGAVTFVDGDTRKIHRRVDLPSSVSHVIPIGNDEVVALGLRMTNAPIVPTYERPSEVNTPDTSRTAEFQSAPIFTVKTDGTWKEHPTAGMNDLFKFNFAYLKIPNSDFAVTSHLGSHRVIVWNDKKPVKVFEMPYPTNLTASADGSEFMVVTDGKARTVSLKTLGPVASVAEGFRVVALATYKV